MNKFQKLVIEHYGDGCFQYVKNHEDIKDAGDSLFTFLINELSDSEYCEDQFTAVIRLDRAIKDIQELLTQVKKL